MIRYPSKMLRSTRSGVTAVVLCNWSMYNFSNHTQRSWSATLLAPDAWLSKTIKRNALDTFRRQKGQSACARICPIEIWWMKLGIGFAWKTISINSSTLLWLLVYIELLALPYILYAQTMIVCGDYFYSTKYCESNNSKGCPALPEAWVAAYAGTHAEPL